MQLVQQRGIRVQKAGDLSARRAANIEEYFSVSAGADNDNCFIRTHRRFASCNLCGEFSDKRIGTKQFVITGSVYNRETPPQRSGGDGVPETD